jgi:glycosyltransferase involved in cell wall biosynthesis
MNSFSVVIITLNEQDNIARCLNSVSQIADEIVIVDAHSTDRTKEIAQSFDVKFYERAWEGFSIAKNFGNNQCTKDWILSIDADEALSEELTHSIKELKKNPIDADLITFNRLTNYCGHWVRFCGWYPDRKRRIFRRGKGIWEGVIHESLYFKDPITNKHIVGDLLHYSFPSISSTIQRLDRYSETAAKEIVGKSKVTLIISMIFNPWFTFFRIYFLKRGFLDGYYGFVISTLAAFSNFLKCVKALHFKKIGLEKK